MNILDKKNHIEGIDANIYPLHFNTYGERKTLLQDEFDDS
jgi:hypothetical protein